MKKEVLFFAAFFMLAGAGSAAAAGEDELWEVKARTEIAGMPFAMPAQTMKVCVPKGQEKDPARAIPQEPNQQCRMSDVKVSGNRTTWKMVCEGEAAMTGSGEMEYGPGRYSGRMKMQTRQEGELMEITTVYEGRKIGTCTYTEAQAVVPQAGGGAGTGAQPEGGADALMEGAKKMKELFGM